MHTELREWKNFVMVGGLIIAGVSFCLVPYMVCASGISSSLVSNVGLGSSCTPLLAEECVALYFNLYANARWRL